MKSKAPNQPDPGIQYDAHGMILDPHPLLPYDPDAVSSMKRPEDMTVAENLDAIFGAGTTDQIFTPEQAAIARQPFNPDEFVAPVKKP